MTFSGDVQHTIYAIKRISSYSTAYYSTFKNNILFKSTFSMNSSQTFFMELFVSNFNRENGYGLLETSYQMKNTGQNKPRGTKHFLLLPHNNNRKGTTFSEDIHNSGIMSISIPQTTAYYSKK